jgi:choline dehydrogenase-like flavoprotein
MPEALIVGSGPAAAGVAMALTQRSDLHVTILDLGLELEESRRSAVEYLSASRPEEWDPAVMDFISEQPAASHVKGLPEKRSYGSDYPFRDIGQLSDLHATADANRLIVSGAYGGFSNLWGSQVMPFTPATFDSWPVRAEEMKDHYKAILREIPFSAEEDDLAELFPLLEQPSPLPPATQRTSLVLDHYASHKKSLRKLGISLGRARLAFDGAACVRCGLCMTGCPYQLIYSASQTFDTLRKLPTVTYRSGLMVLSVEEHQTGEVSVTARDVANDRIETFRADRVFIAAGAIGSSRITANSLRLFDCDFSMGESVQFTLPFMSGRPTVDPRSEPQFTLNQFNLSIALDDVGRDISLLHFYSYNPAFIDAFPSLLRNPRAEPVLSHVLRRVSVALGYLPSWAASPRIHLRFSPGVGQGLPRTVISRDETDWLHNPMLRQVVQRLVRAARRLDLYPLLPMMTFAAGAKSYHFGGSFPHRPGAASSTSTDTLGRVGPWTRIHLVDAAVFPNVAATTFTLTIMANAHRIATETINMPW